MPLVPGGAQLSIASGVREFVRASPRLTAVIDGARSLTYAELGDRASRLATALLTRGLTPGDRVAVLVGNRLEYPELACGIAMAGLVMVPLNPRLTGPEARFIIEHSGSRALVLDDALASIGSEAADECGLIVASIDGSELGPDYEQTLADSSPIDPLIAVDERGPFGIAYTSGTTGRPKGVVISHRSRALTFYCSALEWNLAAGRTSIAVAPMYHGAGFAFGYAPVYTGGTVVMLRKWDPAELLSLIERHRAQSVFLVPTHAQMLRALGPAALADADLSSLDTLFFNAAALPWPLKQWVMDAFPGVGVHELYGSTEAGIVTDLRPADMRRKPGSVGHPWFMTEVRVLDDAGNQVGPGQIGELFSRSPFLMNGYHDNPQATAECTDPDGFLSCGDLVTLDDEGFISVVDRKSDMIISGGVNVYPRDVEEVLAAHPDVAEVAVVGTPSEQWGEQVSAFVVLRPGAMTPSEALEAHCRAQLAGFKIPRTWQVVQTLPRNAAGKVLKRRLRSTADSQIDG